MECLGCKNELLNIYEGNFLNNLSYDFCEKWGGVFVEPLNVCIYFIEFTFV